ncbi:SIMPL domain-containing protein [Patescibacteria group bacterium]|nr:SIMPL domain-containing protein [Patescibacteria group bacterium]
MNEKIKNYLAIAIVVALFLFSLSAVGFVRSYSKSIEPSAFRSFSVRGEGKAIAIPDVAQFTFSVITEGGLDIAGLQKENTQKANSAIDFIKLEGVKTKDIKTQNYTIEPRYQRFSCPRPLPGGVVKPCPPPKIIGYTVRQSVLVKIRNFDTTGDILAGVVKSGVNSVSQLSFTIDDPAELENEARTKAIKQAKEKAKSISKAGGFRLGRLLSIEEGGFFPQPVFRTLEARVAGASAPVPTIEPGSQEIRINVTLRYEIK